MTTDTAQYIPFPLSSEEIETFKVFIKMLKNDGIQSRLTRTFMETIEDYGEVASQLMISAIKAVTTTQPEEMYKVGPALEFVIDMARQSLVIPGTLIPTPRLVEDCLDNFFYSMAELVDND